MKHYWEKTDRSARLTDSREVQPLRKTTLAEAQQLVNFVVFTPEWLPDDCELTEVTVRPEQPPGRPKGIEAEQIGQTPWSEGNPCSIRTVISGHDRRLRLKQFLYDWAPPAASTAPLWNSPRLTPRPCRSTVAWLGTDYMKRQGACIQTMRTQIELSVIDGVFSDEALGRILNMLGPAALEESYGVQRAPFHLLNYWVRYGMTALQVPYGLWKYQHPRRYDQSRQVSLEELRLNTPVRLLLPDNSPYVFDSAVLISEDEPFNREVELIFRHSDNGSDHLWMITMNAESERKGVIPPRPEKHLAEVREVIRLRGTSVWYAALYEEYGAWEAIWEEEGVHYSVWAGATLFQNGHQFKMLVDDLRLA